METVKKEVALIGAGKIGKGYIADLFHDAGYKIIFLCHSLKQAQALRDQGYYTVFKYLEGQEEPIEYKIDNFEAVSTAEEYEQALEVLARVNYATVHLYPSAFEEVGHMIADAICRRVEEGNQQTLDIMLCLNYMEADQIILKHIREKLQTPEQRRYLEEKVGVGMALTFRWGANPRPYMLEKDPLCSCVAESPDLPVDAEAFKGPIPEGVALRPLTKMRERLAFKLWGGNVNGAITANLAMQKGYKYTYQGTLDDHIYLASELGTREAHFGYDQVYHLTQEEKDENLKGRHYGKDGKRSREQMTKRVDEVTRVGADPARKLARKDRLIGPAIACIKAGRVPFFLTKAAAAGFYFVNPADASACAIQKCIQEEGIEAAIIKFCELNMEDAEERMIFQLILGHYYEMSELDPVDIHYCE